MLAFSLLHLEQYEAAATAFHRSVKLGTDSDHQPLVEVLIEHPDLNFSLEE